MLALPHAPAPSRPRMQLVATSLVIAAGSMVMGVLIGVSLHFRSEAGGATADWLPDGVNPPQVAATTMLVTVGAAVVLAQWAVYAMARDDRTHAYQALGLCALFGIAAFNAQVYVWRWMGFSPATDETPYALATVTLTGVWAAFLVGGVLYLLVTVFRSLGGRYGSKDAEGVAAVALYWYFLAASAFPVWYVVYILK